MKWNMMRFSFAERAITCGLLGAVTLAAASGMNRLDVFAQDPAEASGGQGKRRLDSEFEFNERVADGGPSSEQRLAKLVEAVHKATNADKEAKKSALKRALAEIFSNKTEVQQKRISEMRDRLQAVQSQLERRVELQEQIVQRRLSELLGEKDELSWELESAIGPELLESGVLSVLGDVLSDRTRLPNSSGPESPFEFPTEFPPAAAFRELSLPQFRKQAEQAERAATDANRARENHDRARNIESRIREERTQVEGGSRDLSQKRRALVESVRGSLAEKDRLLDERLIPEERIERLQAQLQEDKMKMEERVMEFEQQKKELDERLKELKKRQAQTDTMNSQLKETRTKAPKEEAKLPKE